jgi:hypothetical protein
MKKRLAIYALIALGIALSGCAPSDQALNNADNRIKKLKSQGVPDNVLSPSLVFLYQAKESKRKNESGDARTAEKNLRVELAKAEALYNDSIAKLRPSVDSLRTIIQNAKSKLSGLVLKKFDSIAAVADSFAKIDWPLQAYTKAQELVARIPQFNFDADRSKELRERIPGEWVCLTKVKGDNCKEINAVETKIFTLRKDGSGQYIEKKYGQSGPFFKEDWEFVSKGKWDVNGDTVQLFTSQFTAVRQNFEKLYISDGGKKKTWKKEPQPTYDSTITDGSQDRFVTFSDLKEDFKQEKKF